MNTIQRLLSTALMAASAWMPLQATAAEPSADESPLLAHMQDTVWPQDMVRAAQDYLDRYPQGVWADGARSLQQRASTTAQLLSRTDIRLYNRSVLAAASVPGLKDAVRAAMLGDGDAAVSVAHRLPEGQTARYVGWLQWAAALGNDKAAYELALFFRAQGQPSVASQYEHRAVQLGYVTPTVLDHRRR
jgi:hypothetical protein